MGECTTPTTMESTDIHTPLLLTAILQLPHFVFSSVRPNLTPNIHTATTHTPTPTTTTTSTELLILTPPTIHMLINTPYQDTSFKDARNIFSPILSRKKAN